MPISNQLELRHLKYFLAVAEDLHFRKAADRLFISQPGLSRQIKQMEDDLGVVLFERNNRKVKLTKAGEYLKKELIQNLKNLETIIQHTKLLDKGVEGHLKLGYVGSAMHSIIPNLLLELRKAHANIKLSLEEMPNLKQIDQLLTQDIDLGFVRLERVPRDLAIDHILNESFCLVLPKDHELDCNNFESLTQVSQEAFILFDPSYSPSYYEKIMQIFDHSGFNPIVSHNTVHASTIYRLVENHFGVSIVPKSLQLGYAMGVKFIELRDIPQKAVLSVVWNQNNRNPVLEKFLQIYKSIY